MSFISVIFAVSACYCWCCSFDVCDDTTNENERDDGRKGEEDGRELKRANLRDSCVLILRRLIGGD